MKVSLVTYADKELLQEKNTCDNVYIIPTKSFTSKTNKIIHHLHCSCDSKNANPIYTEVKPL